MSRPRIINLVLEDIDKNCHKDAVYIEEYIVELEQERDQLRSDVARLELERERKFDDMLNWRGIEREAGDEPCSKCSGSGVRVYGTTSTWRGGVGGCAITPDVCDQCWGSGVKDRPWTNLRQKHGRINA